MEEFILGLQTHSEHGFTLLDTPGQQCQLEVPKSLHLSYYLRACMHVLVGLYACMRVCIHVYGHTF